MSRAFDCCDALSINDRKGGVELVAISRFFFLEFDQGLLLHCLRTDNFMLLFLSITHICVIVYILFRA